MSMTAQQVKAAEKFVNHAKHLLAQARDLNHTAYFFNKLTTSEKKAVCTLGNINSRVKLTARHLDMRFEDMSTAERRAIYHGIKELQTLSRAIPTLINISDCD